MYRKILIGGVTAAVIVGSGTAALAASGSDTTNGTASTKGTAATTHAKHAGAGRNGAKKGGRLLRRLEHGEFVTKTKQGTVTHQLIRGTVTAVSATSITVQSADKKSDSFTVGKDTKVMSRSKGQKPAASTIAKVSKGDTVFVGGIGAGKAVAKHVVDLGKK